MKRIFLFVLIFACIMQAVGCSSTVQENTTQSSSVMQESVSDSETDTYTEKIENNNESLEETDFQETKTKHITIDLSASKETHPEGETVTPLEFKIESKTENGVDSADEWYNSGDYFLPMIGDEWNHFYDDKYEYRWMGEYLEIYEKETGNCIYVLQYTTDKWYVNGNNAYLKDGIFYGGSIANGYAQPDTCFMFAYDLVNDKLLWRSASQSYNTMNFIVKDDIIICGYGFTDEKDYLYQINRFTGEIINTFELEKMPDLLLEQDGKLYIHTYSYNYIIEFD